VAFEVVGRPDQFPVGTPVMMAVHGVEVAVVRVSETEVRVIHNVCSHQQYALAPEGWVEDNRIECALHGSMFDLDTGQPDALPALEPIPVYRGKVESDEVLVDVQAQLNDAPAPAHESP
jgi:3-phenylpropionate/trans-cinnamate dioxygenase ferredoxin component